MPVMRDTVAWTDCVSNIGNRSEIIIAEVRELLLPPWRTHIETGGLGAARTLMTIIENALRFPLFLDDAFRLVYRFRQQSTTSANSTACDDDTVNIHEAIEHECPDDGEQ